MNDDLLKFTQESIIRYFTALSQLGYKSYCDTEKLLILIFIQEYLKDYQYYITEEDYNYICKAVENLYGSTCLIPYQYYQTNQATFNSFVGSNVKSTENYQVESTEPLEEVRIIQ